MRCESVPYMNSQLRKAIYKRNMARNKYKKFGHKYWEENCRERNNVVALQKKVCIQLFCLEMSKTKQISLDNYFAIYDRLKKLTNGGKCMLEECDKLITSNDDTGKIFNDYSTNISITRLFHNQIISTEHAIEKHANPQSFFKTRMRSERNCSKLMS